MLLCHLLVIRSSCMGSCEATDAELCLASLPSTQPPLPEPSSTAKIYQGPTIHRTLFWVLVIAGEEVLKFLPSYILVGEKENKKYK